MLPLFLCYVLLAVAIPSAASQPEAARWLLRFRDSLPETSKSLLKWAPTTSPSAHCSWPGVGCYSETDFRVQTLVLKNSNLSGILEESFSYLCRIPDLVGLDLQHNTFTGNLPAELGNCSQLDTVSLYDNRLSGPIPPQIFKPGRLRYLDLGRNQLSGMIPPEVGQCKNITYIGLDHNLLNGEIPIELSNCHDLQFLDLSNNSLGGILDQNLFQGLTNLETLSLHRNRFEGPIPVSLWSLRNLTKLELRENRFTGSIPEDIGQCDRLARLDVSENSITGSIPASVSYLKNLEVIYLNKNNLSGSLPPGIGNCTSLLELEIQSNNLSGVIPREICGLRNLRTIFLNYNHIGGPIPECIDSLISLQVFSVYENRLTGRIPSGVSKMKNLTALVLAQNELTGEIPTDLGRNNTPGFGIVDLTGNRLTGEIPTTICSGNKLFRLTLGDNLLSGSFPTEIIKCKSLFRLFLYNNSLRGSIPNDMGNSSTISHFDIRGNSFEGSIPSVIGSWSNLSFVDLSGNKFSGTIPRELGSLQKLEELNISSNRLTGEILPELSRSPRITKIDLSKNELQGVIPLEIISSSTLAVIWFHDNKLSGVIADSFKSTFLKEVHLGNNLLEGSFPCSLGHLKDFGTLLNLSMNKFSGEIPGCIGDLEGLEILDISSNNFSGKIPTDANEMKALSFLNISYNRQLSGQIPVAWANVLEKHPGTNLGNQKLCSVCGGHKKKAVARGILAGIISGSLLFTACLAVATYKFLTRAWRHTPSSPQHVLLYSRSGNEDLPEDLNFLDILRGTEGWSDKHVIGRGKHGTVYRAESLKSKKQWAVKRVVLTEMNFNSEIRILNLVKHRNILKMGGYSIRNGYGYIVTEYMPEGTLYHLLHQRRPCMPLSWEQRCRIAFGIAQGLSYLHHDCVPPIIHRDIKSDNVLLDSDFEPKIGDFGTAILDSDDDDDDETAAAIIGTLGYIAPENAYSTRLTEKCDVYSYGVILLELLCRKLPVDPSFDEGLDMVSWVRKMVRGYEDRLSWMDEEVEDWEEEEQREAMVMMDLAIQCTEMVPDMRPSMRDVVAYLLKLSPNL